MKQIIFSIFYLTILNCSFLIYYIVTRVLRLSTPPTHSPKPIHSSSVSFQKQQDFQGYQPNIAYQFEIRLVACSHIKAG